jgi:hypothetical protein
MPTRGAAQEATPARREAGGDRAIGMLLTLLDEGFERKAWHGPTLRGALRGVTPEEASWRPAPGRHNIWELVVHAAYWKYMVRRRITGDRTLRFPEPGSDWFSRPTDPSPRAWRADRKLLGDQHRRLRSVVAGLSSADLAHDEAGRKRLWMIRGIMAHDVYHAGQIQLLKRLQRGGV